MKTGLPPVPPVAPVSAPSWAGDAAANGLQPGQTARPEASAVDPHEHAKHGHAHGHGRHKGHLFHAPRGGARPPSVRPQRPPQGAPPPRRLRRTSGPQQQFGDDPDFMPFEEHAPDSYEARRLTAGFEKVLDDTQREAHGEGNNNEGARQQRRFAVVSVARDAARLRFAPLQALQGGAPQPRPITEALTQLRAMAAGLSPALEHTSLSKAFADAALGHLAQVEAHAPATLAAVREALLGAGSAPSDPAKRSESALLWLPIFLLNLGRPRTDVQQRQAIDMLKLIGRATPPPLDRAAGA